ncbi:MAG: ArnT family glycosyltransferase [Anaerolineae bacterium]
MMASRLSHIIRLSTCVMILLGGFWLRGTALDQYPRGLSNDEAINAVDTLHIARTGNFPMYEEDEGRAEPLFRMIEALGMLAFGRSIWALRMVSVLLSVPLIAIVMWITREYLHDYPTEVRWLASLFAGVALATMAGHVTLSRTLYRGVLQLLTMGLSIGFVLRGLRRDQWQDYALSGLFGGLTLYTYTASWFFPPAFLVLGGALLTRHWRTWRTWVPKLALLGMVALVIASPVLYLLITYPRAVLGRAEALTPEAINWWRATRVMIDQFLLAGDENPQYNVDFAPIVPEIMRWMFYIGLVAMLIRIRQARTWFLLALLILLALPAMLSDELTHGLRIAGEYAVVPIIIGLGAGLLIWSMMRVITRPVVVRTITLALCISIGGINGTYTWTRYTEFFDQTERGRLWDVHEMQLNHNEWFFRIDRQDFANWVTEQEKPILIPRDELTQQSTRSWLMNAYPTVRVADREFILPDSTQLVMPWSLEQGDLYRDTRHFALLDEGIITLLPPITADSHQQLLADVDAGTAITRIGQIDFLGSTQSVADITLNFEPVRVVDAVFGEGDMRLVGWGGSDTLDSNTLSVTLAWQAEQRIGHEYLSSLQVQTQDYERVGSIDAYILRWLYPTTIWSQGATVYNTQTIMLPDDLSAGAYRLTTGLFYASYPLIDARSETLSVLNNRVTVGWLKVPQSEPTIPESTEPVGATIGDLFTMTHIEFTNMDGQLLGQIYWRGLVQRPDVDATIFVHIVDESGQIVAQSDNRPHNGQYPTFIWDEGEIVRTDHRFNFSDLDNLDAYRVRVGMYVFPGPENLSVRYQEESLPDGLIELGRLDALFSP